MKLSNKSIDEGKQELAFPNVVLLTILCATYFVFVSFHVWSILVHSGKEFFFILYLNPLQVKVNLNFMYRKYSLEILSLKMLIF